MRGAGRFLVSVIVAQINSVPARRGSALCLPATGDRKGTPLRGQNFSGYLYARIVISTRDEEKSYVQLNL